MGSNILFLIVALCFYNQRVYKKYRLISMLLSIYVSVCFPIAQDYESEGRTFESFRARQFPFSSASLIYRCGFCRGFDSARNKFSAINSLYSQGNQSGHMASFVDPNLILRCLRRVSFVIECDAALYCGLECLGPACMHRDPFSGPEIFCAHRVMLVMPRGL